MSQKKSFEKEEYYGNYLAYIWYEKILPVLLIAFVLIMISSVVYFIKWIIDPFSVNSF